MRLGRSVPDPIEHVPHVEHVVVDPDGVEAKHHRMVTLRSVNAGTLNPRAIFGTRKGGNA